MKSTHLQLDKDEFTVKITIKKTSLRWLTFRDAASEKVDMSDNLQFIFVVDQVLYTRILVQKIKWTKF